MTFSNPDKTKPLLTVLNFSGGKQSSCILHMVLRGELAPPSKFVVLNADPGMEDSRTYIYIEKMKLLCAEAGIEFITVPGPNLYKDLLDVKNKTRIDNPPYFVTNANGKTGKLMQSCTKYYKIDPMNQEVRRILHRDFGCKLKAPPPANSVEKWIGFHADEWHRVSESGVKYSYFKFPLIEANMNDALVAGYFLKHNIEKPPRSVCCACFANSMSYFKEMYETRPDDWQKTLSVDEAIRNDMCRVNGEVFVNQYRVPMRLLPEFDFMPKNFKPEKEMGETCNFGGYCFV